MVPHQARDISEGINSFLSYNLIRFSIIFIVKNAIYSKVIALFPIISDFQTFPKIELRVTLARSQGLLGLGS